MPRTFDFLHRFEGQVARRAAASAERGVSDATDQAEPDFATLVADVARTQAATEAARVETAAPAIETLPPGAGVVDTLVAVLAPVAGEQTPSGSFNRMAARRVPARTPNPATARPVHGLAPIRTLATPRWEQP